MARIAKLPTSPTNPRVAAYLRISKDPDGASTATDRQLKDITALCAERGWEIAEVYEDTDLSAYRAVHRPRYEALLDAMTAGDIDIVVVWKLDRLMRRIVEFSRFWTTAETASVQLISKNDPVDTTSPLGLAVVYLIVALAEQESANTSLRLRAKEIELAEAGRHKHAGRRAYGMVHGWTETEAAEAKVIRDMADRVLTGEPVGSIARDLNERGIPSATGKRWTRAAITTLLCQARLFGKREHHGVIVADGDWPPILDEHTGMRLRAVLERNPTGPRAPTRRHLLSGVSTCGNCGARLRATGTTTNPKYACPPVTEGGCAQVVVNRTDADTEVISRVLQRLADPEVIRAATARRGSKGDDAELLAELAGIETQRSELAEMWAGGELDRGEWSTARRRLDERTVVLSDRLDDLRRSEPVARLAAGDIGAAWNSMSGARRRSVIEALAEQVRVHPVRSEFTGRRIRVTLEAEAAEAERVGDRRLAARRRRQLESGVAGHGAVFRPERIEVVWR